MAQSKMCPVYKAWFSYTLPGKVFFSEVKIFLPESLQNLY